jgi:hypothetical protein
MIGKHLNLLVPSDSSAGALCLCREKMDGNSFANSVSCPVFVIGAYEYRLRKILAIFSCAREVLQSFNLSGWVLFTAAQSFANYGLQLVAF